MVDILHRNGVNYKPYSLYVKPNAGSEDTSFLPIVGEKGYILITADWKQRIRPREVADIKRYKVRHFEFCGNLSRVDKARLLIKAKNSIFACCRENEAPINASVARDGSVRVLSDSRGSLHDRGEVKIYVNGKLRKETRKAKAANAVR